MKPTLTIVVTPSDTVKRATDIKMELAGAMFRNGTYIALYEPFPGDVRGNVTMKSIGTQFPLHVSGQVDDLADALAFVTDYFTRHGCLA